MTDDGHDPHRPIDQMNRWIIAGAILGLVLAVIAVVALWKALG